MRQVTATLGCTATALLLGFGPAHAAAQDDVTTLAEACAAGSPGVLAGPCLESALAVRAVQGLVGLSATGASGLPGSSSTLGKRFGGTPRLALSAGFSLVRGSLPEVLAPTGGVSPSESLFLTGFQATGAAGIFQGFSTAPTVGGILAVDALASFAYTRAPNRLGFGEPATGFGLGVRLGVLRESFTLPGVTLSLTRHWMGTTSLSSDAGDAGEVGVTASSIRLTVGKEFLAFGLHGGAGWDRYTGRAMIEVRPAGGTGPVGSAETGSFETKRAVVFGGVGYTFLVAQVALDGGWAKGYDAPAGRPSSGFDPESGSMFARLSFRLTL